MNTIVNSVDAQQEEAQSWTLQDSRRTTITIQTLEDLITKAHPHLNFCLGIASSFVFLGTIEEFRKDFRHLEQYINYRSRKKPYNKPWIERSIIDCYERRLRGEPEKYIIVMEGTENGPFWLRSEYEEFKVKMNARIEAQRKAMLEENNKQDEQP